MVAKQMRCGSRVGQDATATQLRSDLASPFALLHIASHAASGLGTSQSPAIALRNASDTEGVEWLTASEVRKMRLQGRLVVLSACGSPSGEGSRDALGLADAFVAAGAAEAIGARWMVDDSATLEFMRVFYHWLGHNRDTAIALRNARGGLIGGTFLPYRSPYFWAAFASLIADPFPTGHQTHSAR